ncbi:MAG: phage integrase SAM-like domain-containing protein [Pseudomonadota bacterium]
MRTLNLEEAALFLKLPIDYIISEVESGLLPGAKLSDDFIFIDEDLTSFIRNKYFQSKNANSVSKLNALEQTETIFKELIPHVLRTEQNRVMRGELTAKSLRITENRLAKWVRPYFDEIPIIKIDYLTLEDFIEKLTESDIKGVAISQYLIIIRKVLNYALITNLITRLPLFPKVKTPRQSRGPFTIVEYRNLLKTAWRLRDQPYMMQHRPRLININEGMKNEVYMPKDMTRLIGFMVNSFIRPSDLKFLQHKHVEVIESNYRYLRLSLPETKKHDQPIVTMTACVGIYKRILKDAKALGYGKPNDFVFLPEISKNRDHALRHMGFLLMWVLNTSNLKYGSKGQNRTLYCLRHTAITFRLLYGEGVDLLTLAKNARTSVNMIEKHYASTLNGEMNISLLHSKRVRKFNSRNQ